MTFCYPNKRATQTTLYFNLALNCLKEKTKIEPAIKYIQQIYNLSL